MVLLLASTLIKTNQSAAYPLLLAATASGHPSRLMRDSLAWTVRFMGMFSMAKGARGGVRAAGQMGRGPRPTCER